MSVSQFRNFPFVFPFLVKGSRKQLKRHRETRATVNRGEKYEYENLEHVTVWERWNMEIKM